MGTSKFPLTRVSTGTERIWYIGSIAYFRHPKYTKKILSHLHDGPSHGFKRTRSEYLSRSLFSAVCDVVAVDGLVRVVAGSVPVVVFVFFRSQLVFVPVPGAVLP